MGELRSGSCFRCGGEIAASEYGRSEVCVSCRADTKCCRNCEFYDASVSRECREPSAEPPHAKDRANFCELFRPARPKADGDGASGKPSSDQGRSAFDALFKKPD